MECCAIVEAIRDGQEDERLEAKHRRKLKRKLNAAELYERMEAEFEAIEPGDFKRLAAWAEWYMVHRTKEQILKRPKCDLFARYMKSVEDEADAIYAAALQGELTRNEAINLFLGLAENMARGLTKLSRHLADDLESVAHQRLFWIFEKLPVGITKFYGWLVLRLQNKIAKFKDKERKQERFRDEGSDGRDEVDADELSDRDIFGRDRSSDRLESVDAADELDSLCRDDIDKDVWRMRAQGFANREIGNAVGLTTSAISLRVRKMEGRRDERLRSVCEDSIDDQILNMRIDGKSDKTIASHCGINQATVESRLRTLNRRCDRQTGPTYAQGI